MRIEELRTALGAQPFRPFNVHVAERLVIPVRHPHRAFITEGGGTIFINTRGENVEMIGLSLVTGLSFPPRRRKRSN